MAQRLFYIRGALLVAIKKLQLIIVIHGLKSVQIVVLIKDRRLTVAKIIKVFMTDTQAATIKSLSEQLDISMSAIIRILVWRQIDFVDGALAYKRLKDKRSL